MMNKALAVFGVIFIILLLGGGFIISGLNHIVTLHENVQASWSQVENQLQRRNDLIPNLVNTVKGYATQERTIFTEVARLRSQWAAATQRADKIKVAEDLSGTISRLLLVVENYPELKSNQNFLTLQAQLEGTENRLAVERNRYNRAVRDFNTYIRTIAGSIFACWRGLNKPEVYFEAEAAARAVPRVDF